MVRKLLYLLIGNILGLACLVLVGCSQASQAASVATDTAEPTATAIPATATAIPPTPTPASRVETLRVNQLTESALAFKKGEFVWIQPGGEVTVGPFVGSVGPEGVDSIVLAGYSIVPDIPHGALLCRIQGQTEWYYCGEETEVKLDTAGQLEFQVNDNDQGNNDPNTAFMVRITVAPYSVRGRQETQVAHQPANQPSDNSVAPVAPAQTQSEQVNISDDFHSPTEGCQHLPGDDPNCQSECYGRTGDANCTKVEDYNAKEQRYQEAQDDKEKQQAEDERRKQQEQEEEQRRQQEEEDRQRQQQEQQQQQQEQQQQQQEQQQQQQDNSSGN